MQCNSSGLGSKELEMMLGRVIDVEEMIEGIGRRDFEQLIETFKTGRIDMAILVGAKKIDE